MGYKIIVDSCTDLTDDMKGDKAIALVPLSIQIDDLTIIDDETFNQRDFLEKVKNSPNAPKSSCPSPEAYMKLFDEEDDIYVVTLSGNLSGSYNSAELAKKLYLEENPKKNIHIFNSCSASVGQTLITRKIIEHVQNGKTFEDVVKMVQSFREKLSTMFVLESLETLRKSGRLTNLQAIIASALNIKPVMGATPEGTIKKLDQARGIQKALMLMSKLIEADVKGAEDRTLGIAHCNNYERALFVKEEILKRVPFKDTIIVDTNGISSMYAGDGGIIVSF